jgi:hypothetical protein
VTKQKPKPKGRRSKYAPGLSPTEVAKAAACSRPLAYRLLRRGMSPAQIVERAAERKARLGIAVGPRQVGLTIGKGQSNVTGNHHGNGNGFDGRAAVETFSAAQTRKESALADLRSLEYRQRNGDLVEVAEVRDWMNHLLRPMVGALRHLPAELRDQFTLVNGPQFEELLLSRIDNVLLATVSYLAESVSRAGKRLSDGALRVDEYQVRWVIELAPPEVSPAADVPNGSAPGTEAMQ